MVRSVAEHVAFLRAVNVGKRRVEMAKLRTELESIGLDGVSTYINSGNAVFSSRKEPAALEPLIEAHLELAFGFVVETFVRTAAQVVAMSEQAPFGAIPDGETHMVALLRSAPDAAGRRTIEALSGDQDELVVIGAEVHWHISGKSLDSALKPKDWKAAGAGLNTTRNITMLRKLAAKLDG